MSADNWAVCPRCRTNVDGLNQARINAPGKAYGKVAADVYHKLVDDAKSLLPYKESLREDFGIGIVKTDRDEKPRFVVDYSARCIDCGFTHKFKHETEIKP